MGNDKKIRTFGISMATYRRPDGSTSKTIWKSLDSILNQNYPHWKLYLIGDNYSNEKEFKKYAKAIPKDKIYTINLDTSERDLPDIPNRRKWQICGLNAINTALRQQHKDKIDITCQLDDDDIWRENHLEVLNWGYESYPESVFVFTRGAIFGKGAPPPRRKRPKGLILPPVSKIEIEYNNYMPRCKKLVHSSVSWKLSEIPFFYESQKNKSCDCVMWERITKFCNKHQKKTLYIPQITVKKRWKAPPPKPWKV